MLVGSQRTLHILHRSCWFFALEFQNLGESVGLGLPSCATHDHTLSALRPAPGREVGAGPAGRWWPPVGPGLLPHGRPSPYHRGAGKWLGVVEAGHQGHAGRSRSSFVRCGYRTLLLHSSPSSGSMARIGARRYFRDMTDWTGIAAVIAPITTLLGVLGGYWLAGRNEEARDRRAAQREASSRQEAISERLEENRHTFQRDTLVQLQDEIQALLRVTAHDILHRQRMMLDSGQLSPEPVRNEDGNQVRASVSRLQERLLDDSLRAAVSEFTDFCAHSAAGTALALAHPYGSVAGEDRRREAVTFLQHQAVDLGNLYSSLTKQIGVSLRREMDRRHLATTDMDASENPR